MTLTVLVVDDEAPVRQLLSRILTDHGYRTLEAADGREAWHLISRGDSPIDVVLADVVMPHMTGTELAALVERHRPELPVVFMSALTPAEMRTRGLGEPGGPVLTKPFLPNEVVRVVGDASRGSG